jgi:hypothetical protein
MKRTKVGEERLVTVGRANNETNQEWLTFVRLTYK